MSFLGQEFNVNDLPVNEKSGDFEPLPEGWYNATISNAELKQTQAGTGEYISVRYDITGPSHQGRVVFGSLNIKNPSAQAESIGRQQLGELMRAIGLAKVTDTDQLIGSQLAIKLTVRKQEGFKDKNDVKGYKSTGHAPAVVEAPKAAAPSSKGAPPWAKK